MQILEKSSSLQDKVEAKATAAKNASRVLANVSAPAKNEALRNIANALKTQQEFILAANALDVADAEKRDLTKSFIDRLTLNPARISDMAEGVETIIGLQDPIGEIIESWTLQNGIAAEKVRVPLGVIAMVYEARPNVTVDAAALAIKTGNAVVLRGSADALRTNIALVNVLQKALNNSEVPGTAIQLLDTAEHESVDILVRLNKYIDLVIPRGGAGLIRSVIEKSTVPVIETGVGNCHVYIDAESDPQMAVNIIINAKTQKPSVCNAAETLLVHEAIAQEWLPVAISELQAKGVEIRGCDRTCRIVKGIKTADESDWEDEFLDLTLAVKVVKNVAEAVDHIEKYGTKHSESIVTSNKETAKYFLEKVDAAAVYHNASTRITDGYRYGFGAEIGISTQKLHARGPMGLKELTSYKYICHGNGQIVE